MAGEVADCGNKEPFFVCMRWINDNLEAVECFIGLYNVDNIKADTLAAAIKDVLVRMNLSLQEIRGRVMTELQHGRI